jgi:hypothetical protein
LGDAEVDADGHERDRLILAQSLGGHQKTAHLRNASLSARSIEDFL